MDKTIYLIRHAERKKNQKGWVSNLEPITQEGAQQSIELGKSLSSLDELSFFTSPILRCKQTASAIVKGFDKPALIEESKLFGDPGAYILDPSLAREAFEKFTNERVIEKYIYGEVFPGFASLKWGSEEILSFFYSLQASRTLIVTHDSILAFLASFIFKTKKIENIIYDYLKGMTFILSTSEKKIYCSPTLTLDASKVSAQPGKVLSF